MSEYNDFEKYKHDPIAAFGWHCYEVICWRAARFGQKYGMNTLRQIVQDQDIMRNIYKSARETRLGLVRHDDQFTVVCLVKCGREGCLKSNGHRGEKGKHRM